MPSSPPAQHGFTAQDVSTALWAVAKLGVHAEAIVDACTSELPRVADAMNTQDVAETLWAMGRLHKTHAASGGSRYIRFTLRRQINAHLVFSHVHDYV